MSAWFRVESLLPFEPAPRDSLTHGEEIWYTINERGKEIHGPFMVVVNGTVNIRNRQGVVLPITKIPKVQFYRMLKIA